MEVQNANSERCNEGVGGMTMKELGNVILNRIAQINAGQEVTLTNGVSYQIKNGFCILRIEGGTATKTGEVILATLPVEARPPYNAQPFYRSGINLQQCWVTQDGQVHVQVSAAHSNGAGFCFWPVS